MAKRLWTERHAKFVREVGSIILGVLIALGLGAVATQIGWRVDVASARDAVGRELASSMGQANIRLLIYSCVDQRLDAVGEVLDRASETGRLPPIGKLRMPPWATWEEETWQSTVASDAAAHMSRDEQTGYGGTYEFVQMLHDSNRKEVDYWTKLYAIVGPGRKIGEAEIVALRTSLSEARFMNRFIALSSERMRQLVAAYALPYDEAYAQENGQVSSDRLKNCGEIPAFSGEVYGSAPFSNVIESARRDPITRNNGG